MENGLKKLKEKETKIQEEEKKLSNKKLITPEEYKKSIRVKKRGFIFAKERNSLLESIAKIEQRQEVNY